MGGGGAFDQQTRPLTPQFSSIIMFGVRLFYCVYQIFACDLANSQHSWTFTICHVIDAPQHLLEYWVVYSQLVNQPPIFSGPLLLFHSIIFSL